MANNRFLETAEKWKNQEVPNERDVSYIPKFDNVLCFSMAKKIFALDTDNPKYFKIIAERDSVTNSLCVHNGTLYDASGNNIYDTLKNKKVSERSSLVRTLCSHQGNLYDGGNDCKVFNSLSDKVISKREKPVRVLCSNENTLYDGGLYNQIFETLTNKLVASRESNVHILCFHEGRLYDATGNSIFDTLRSKLIAKRENSISVLYSHNGRLYDGGLYNKILLTGSSIIPARRPGPTFNICANNGIIYDGGNGGGGGIYFTWANKLICNQDSHARTFCSVPRQFLLQNGVNIY